MQKRFSGHHLRRTAESLALEPRLMFDAAVASTADSVITDNADSNTFSALNGVETSASLPAPGNQTLLVIDTSAPNWQQLAEGRHDGIALLVLDPQGDGLAQIGAALAQMGTVDAVHIVSHGADNNIQLGSTRLSAESIASYSDTLAAWSAHLSPNADVLIYGCNVAASAPGQSLIDSLAQVTGADVAASTDNTGAAALGGNWQLEYAQGSIESAAFLDSSAMAGYQNILATVNLSGRDGWTAAMFGTGKDPQGDSQAGAADTDIIGDATHGSLYVAYDDNGTASTADDTLVFRLRIDNPTSSTVFGGVAVVGIDANLDGKIDLFMSIDGRNNGQAVKLLDPGTGLNISPNTTTTNPLPGGWLPNNGVYPLTAGNYSVVAVSAGTDPHFGPSSMNPTTGTATDLSGDGKTDIFVSWRIPIADMATVLAKPSPVDRNGIYGPRGATGIAGYDQNTLVRYVSFTQTQNGPINGDLNGVGSAYDKNATFDSLGTFTEVMSAADPVSASNAVHITEPISGGYLNDAEDDSVSISGSSTGSAGQTLALSVSDGVSTVIGTTTINGDGSWTVSGLNLSGLNDGTLTVSASATSGGYTASDSTTVIHDKTAPLVSVTAGTLQGTARPTFTGTSDLAEGSLLTVVVDPDNDAGTSNSITWLVVVGAGGGWSLDTSTAPPSSGTIPASGIPTISKVTATATDTAGNSTSATALNAPTVTPRATNNITPTINGRWTNIAGDMLTVTVNGITYNTAGGNLVVTGNTWALTIPSGNALTVNTTYSVTATVTRNSDSISDTTNNELTITNTPVINVDINGGPTASGTNTLPTITGTSQNAGGFVVVRLDPGNDGDLSDAVTYSVTPDGGGNWSLDTATVQPISGLRPPGGYIGAIGIRATDSTGAVSDVQVLTITTPTIAITGISSSATANGFGQILNSGAGANFLNITEDDAVVVTGTASGASSVEVTITGPNGNFITVSGVSVTSGTWTTAGINISMLDNGVLNVRATITDTAISASNTSVTHDKIAPRIFITNPDEIKKNGGVIYGRSELANTSLTVTVRNAADTVTEWTGTVTTDANGNWTATTSGNLVSGSSGTVIIKVQPTSTATDSAGNIAQQATKTQFVAANASSSTITIGTIAGDNIITSNEIASGVVISGTTSLSGTPLVSVRVTDDNANFVDLSATASGGTWSVTLSNAQIKTLVNGTLTVNATAPDGTITIRDVAVPNLSLPSPTLVITDNTPGVATGAVTYTFTFNEAVTGFDASDINVTNGTKGTFTTVNASTYTLVVTPPASSSGNINVSVANNIATATSTGRGNIGDSDVQSFDTTGAAAPPTLSINTDDLATSSTPIITGTTSLAPGAPIVINIDLDNDGSTDLSYASTVQSGGVWTLDIANATPTAGTLPGSGLNSDAKITAVATNAYGNSTSVIGHNKPAVNTLTTNSSTPTVTGTWTNVAGDVLSVVINGVTYSVANGNLSITGNSWSLTSGTLADGSHNVTATTTRSATNKADITTAELFIDTDASVQITSHGGGATGLTNDPTPVITGTSSGIPAGSLITVTLDIDNNGSADVTYRTTIAGDGSWSIDTGTVTPTSGSFPAGGLSGPVPISASATDPAGNTGSDTQTLTVDVTPPVISITSNTRTPDASPVITGTTDLPAGSTLTVTINPGGGDASDAFTYNVTVQPGGTWSVDTADAPATGTRSDLSGETNTVSASGTDSAGNTGTTSSNVAIDLSTPTVVITAPLPSVGADNSADVNEDDAIVVLGNSTDIAAGGIISIVLTDGVITINDTATVQADGSWSLAPLNLSAMAHGLISVTASYVDNGGNTYSNSYSFTHDKTATVTIDSISEDTGVIGDFNTTDNTLTITGSADSGPVDSVVVKNASNVIVATFSNVAVSSGSWTTSTTATLPVGDYTIEATIGATTVTRSMTVLDATPPTLSSSGPADDATNVAVSSNITLTFDKNVRAGSGFVGLYRSDGTLIESFNVSTGAGDAGGLLSFNGTTGVTIDPFADLNNNTGYYLTINSGAITDSNGNAYAGINDSTTLNFTTVSGADTTAPDAPTVDLLASSDSGSSNSDDLTNITTPTLRVFLNGAGATAPLAGDSVQLYANAVQVGSATLNATNISNGYVDITSSVLTAGSKNFTATVTDQSSNVSAASPTLTVEIDTTAPTVTITDNVAGTANGDVTFTFQFSEGVSGFTSGDVVVTGGTKGTFTTVDADTFTLVVTPTASTQSGSITVDVAGSVAQDSAGNNNTAATQATQAYDTLAPTVALTTGSANVNAAFTVTATYSEAVSGFTAGEISVTNASVSAPSSSDGGTTWTFTVTPSSEGAVSISVPSGTAQDGAGNDNTASNALAVTYDTTPPATPVVNTLYTNSTTPTITGTSVLGAGETLQVTVNGATYNVTPDVSNNWSIDLSGATPASGTLGTFSYGSSYAVTAVATDTAGNSATDGTTNELHIVAAPTQASNIVSMSKDSGTAGDFITNDGTANRTVSGTISAVLGTNEIVEVSFDNGSSWTTASTTGTNWTVTDTGSHGGDWIIQARVTNTSISMSATADSQSVTLDTTDPATPTANVLYTNSTTPTITGSAALGAGESLQVTVNGATYNVTPDVSNNWSIDLSSATPVSGSLGTFSYGSSYAVTAVATDTAGNSATDATTNELHIVAVPTQTSNIVSMSKDSGTAGDFITNDGTANRTVSGTISAVLGTNEIVEVSFDNGSTWTTAATVGTNWSVTDSGAHSADWTIQARVTNTSINMSATADTQTVMLDVTAPALPTVNSLNTSSTTPTLTGTAILGTGETLRVSVNGATYSVTPGIAGDWSLNLASAIPISGSLGTFSTGTIYSVTATSTDAAGNASNDATSNELAIIAGPTQTASILAMSKDSGTAGDFITNDGSANRSVTGTLSAALGSDEVVEVSFNNGVTWSPATTTGTNWSVTDTTAHLGNWTLLARVTNTLISVSGATDSQVVTLDTLAPATPAVNSLNTSSTAPTLTGTAILGTGETLSVSVNGATYDVTPNGLNVWTLDLATATPANGTLGSLTSGNSYPVTAVARDIAGNTATDLTTDELRVVAVPTQTSTITGMSKDTGVAGDFITKDGSANRTVTGTISAPLAGNEIVEVSFDNGVSWTTATTTGNNWSVTDNGSHNGDWTILSRVTNTLINASSTPGVRVVTLDTLAPAAPVVNPVSSISTTPTLTGTALLGPGETLSVSVHGATYQVTPNNLGAWTLDLATATPVSGVLGTLINGNNYSVTATVTDTAGNSSSDPTSNELRLDPLTTPPPSNPPIIVPPAPLPDVRPPQPGQLYGSTPIGTGSPGDTPLPPIYAPAPLNSFALAPYTSRLGGSFSTVFSDWGRDNGMQPVLSMADALQYQLDLGTHSSASSAMSVANARPTDVGANISILSRETLQGRVNEIPIVQATVKISAGLLAGRDILFLGVQSAGISVSYDPMSGTLQMNGKGTAAEYELMIRSLKLKDSSGGEVNGKRTLEFSITNERGQTLSGSKEYVNNQPAAVDDAVPQPDADQAKTAPAADQATDDSPVEQSKPAPAGQTSLNEQLQNLHKQTQAQRAQWAQLA